MENYSAGNVKLAASAAAAATFDEDYLCVRQQWRQVSQPDVICRDRSSSFHVTLHVSVGLPS